MHTEAYTQGYIPTCIQYTHRTHNTYTQARNTYIHIHIGIQSGIHTIISYTERQGETNIGQETTTHIQRRTYLYTYIQTEIHTYVHTYSYIHTHNH